MGRLQVVYPMEDIRIEVSNGQKGFKKALLLNGKVLKSWKPSIKISSVDGDSNKIFKKIVAEIATILKESVI